MVIETILSLFKTIRLFTELFRLDKGTIARFCFGRKKKLCVAEKVSSVKKKFIQGNPLVAF